MEFVIDDLTHPIAEEVYTIQCNKCDTKFKTAKTSTIKRHYESRHEYQFVHIRERKRRTDLGCLVPAKVQRLHDMTNEFSNAKEYLNTCSLLQCQAALPFAFWDRRPIKRLLGPYTTHYGISVHSKSMRNHLKDVETDIKEQIRDQLRGKFVCLLFDIGSRFGKSFLGIGAQYMDQLEIKIVHLGMVVMHERNTAKYIEERIIKILGDFNVTIAQVYTITTDNGANVLRTSEDILHAAAIAAAESDELIESEDDDDDEINVLDEGQEVDSDDEDQDNDQDDDQDAGIEGALTDLLEKGRFDGSATLVPTRCAAHTVQLAVHDCLARWSTEMVDMKAACTEIRSHIKNARLNINMPPKPNATRWSSEYRMVKAMVEIRSPHIERFMTPQQWELAEEMAKGLAPVQELTTRLQAEQYVFGDLLGDLLMCEADLEETESTFAQILLEKLRKRKKTIMDIENLPLQAALYLDPRFNNIKCALLSADQKRRIVGYIGLVHKRLLDLKKKQPDSAMDIGETTDADNKETKLARIARMLPQAAEPEATPKAMASIHTKLYDLQFRSPPTGANFNVLQHWKGENDPELAELTNVILSVPASQVSVERAFSSLPLILSKKRTSLHDKNLERLLFVKLNPTVVPRF